ncbi:MULTISPECIES: NigD-like protein [Parabacteroides]|jgi:hypothetical protein|nr:MULTISPECIES: NigD-like protein [Parabacteroides]
MIHAMKTLKTFMLLFGILLGSTTFYSCLDTDDSYSEFWKDKKQAIVTVKPLTDNTYYMQLNDSITLFPTNSYVPENLKEIRAYVILRESDKVVSDYDKAVEVIRMDTLLTKEIAPDLGAENDSYYGTDMLALSGASNWFPGGAWIEDGYVTFDFLVNKGEKHFLNLVQTNSADPYELEFRHRAENGDYTYQPLPGLVSFKLDKLPSTEGKTVKLKIKYKSFAINDYRTIELDYKSKE